MIVVRQNFWQNSCVLVQRFEKKRGIRRGLLFILLGLAQGVGGLPLCDLQAQSTNLVIESVIPPEPPSGEDTGFTKEFLIDVWRTPEGLPDNAVNALLQSRDGYLWVGTSAGLVRFDGIRFTPLSDQTADGRNHDHVTALLEDQTGKMWIGTQGRGLLCYANGELRRFTTMDGLADNTISSLAQDALNELWIGTRSGLNRLADKTFTECRTSSGSSLGAVSGIHIGKSGRLWITTRSGIYERKNGVLALLEFNELPAETRTADFNGVYSDSKGNIWAYGETFLLNLNQGKRFNYFRSTDSSASRVWTIYEQRNGELWIGTSGRGIFRFRRGKFESIGGNVGLLHNDVRAILEDREGDLWVGTSGGGLARLKPRRLWAYGVEEGLPESSATSLCADNNGRLFAGFSGAGLFTGLPEHFERFESVAAFDDQNYVWTVCHDLENHLWVGTWGSGLFCLKPGGTEQYSLVNGLADNVILAIASDLKGGVWIGTLGGQVQYLKGNHLETYSVSDGLSGMPVISLLICHDGTLWVGSNGGGLVSRHGNRFESVVGRTGENDAIIRTLFEDSAQRLWIGTGGGLLCLANGHLRRCNTKEGLPDNSVGQILGDDDGNLWLGCEHGIFEIRAPALKEFADGRVRNLSPLLYGEQSEQPLSKAITGWPTALKTADGKLWFTTGNGLVSLDPRRFELNEIPPAVIIEEARVDGRIVAGGHDSIPASPLIISSSMRNLDFQFTALSFIEPSRVQFQHKLDGYDLDWVEDGPVRKAHYGTLPTGDYVFRVKACNNDGVWNEQGATLALSVVPPVWRAGWFLALSAVLSLGLVGVMIRFLMLRRLHLKLQHSEQRQLMEKERTRIARNMHDEIGSKLTRISYLSELAKSTPKDSAESEELNASVSEASRELLSTLDELVWAVDPRNDNLEQLAVYLGQYASEYFHMTPLECRVEIAPLLPHSILTSEVRHNLFLAFKEALNNILKHAAASSVRIEMRHKSGMFQMTIVDNGRGFDLCRHNGSLIKDGPSRRGNGLVNMRLRLSDVGGTLLLRSEPGAGTNVDMILHLSEDAPVESHSEN
jgi:ligand-binding sensor domain-containing protein/signal transduction histidine kinase